MLKLFWRLWGADMSEAHRPNSASPLWTAVEAAQATGGRAVGNWSARGVAIDTRDIQEGDLFVALKDQRDGHTFIPEAYRNGVAACVSSWPIEVAPALVVSDTLQALQALGTAARERAQAVRIGVTGSVGKTSAKEMTRLCLAAAGPAHWSVKSYNNHWGVPLTLARMPRETQRAVFEMGMNHSGEIRSLTAQVRPHLAGITKIAPAHIENLGSLEAIADAKSEIFEGLVEGGIAVLPLDDPFFDHLAGRARACGAEIRTFSTHGVEGDARLLGVEAVPEGTRLSVSLFGERADVHLASVGEHWAANALMALLFARLSDVSLADAAEGLSGFSPPQGRGATFRFATADGGSALIIDDAYNANPESMRAALAAMAQRPAKRRLAVLGHMLELGPDGAAMHAGLAEPLQAAGVSRVFMSGQGMRALEQALPPSMVGGWVESAQAMIETLSAELQDGDVVLLKGSNGSGMWRVAQALKDTSNAVSGG